jgi:hypothetical protein
MDMRWTAGALIFGAALLGAGTAAAQSAPEAGEPATKLLFETPHLSGVAPGTRLSYSFSHATTDAETLGEPFEDSIDLEIQPAERSDRRDVRVILFTGERHRAAGPFENMSGNPIIILFLEHDVQQMSEELKGNPFYLRSRIKEAMRTAVAHPTEVRFNGKEIEAWKIDLEPFVGETGTPRLDRMARKHYQFVLADDVPGGIYRISASAPGEDGATPLVSDELELAGVAEKAADK